MDSTAPPRHRAPEGIVTTSSNIAIPMNVSLATAVNDPSRAGNGLNSNVAEGIEDNTSFAVQMSRSSGTVPPGLVPVPQAAMNNPNFPSLASVPDRTVGSSSNAPFDVTALLLQAWRREHAVQDHQQRQQRDQKSRDIFTGRMEQVQQQNSWIAPQAQTLVPLTSTNVAPAFTQAQREQALIQAAQFRTIPHRLPEQVSAQAAVPSVEAPSNARLIQQLEDLLRSGQGRANSRSDNSQVPQLSTTPSASLVQSQVHLEQALAHAAMVMALASPQSQAHVQPPEHASPLPLPASGNDTQQRQLENVWQRTPFLVNAQTETPQVSQTVNQAPMSAQWVQPYTRLSQNFAPPTPPLNGHVPSPSSSSDVGIATLLHQIGAVLESIVTQDGTSVNNQGQESQATTSALSANQIQSQAVAQATQALATQALTTLYPPVHAPVAPLEHSFQSTMHVRDSEFQIPQANGSSQFASYQGATRAEPTEGLQPSTLVALAEHIQALAQGPTHIAQAVGLVENPPPLSIQVPTSLAPSPNPFSVGQPQPQLHLLENLIRSSVHRDQTVTEPSQTPQHSLGSSNGMFALLQLLDAASRQSR
jgi:hypothetical protein